MSEQSLISEQEQQEINKKLTGATSAKSYPLEEMVNKRDQDRFFMLPFDDKKLWFAGIFDGMGGGVDGQEASTLAMKRTTED